MNALRNIVGVVAVTLLLLVPKTSFAETPFQNALTALPPAYVPARVIPLRIDPFVVAWLARRDTKAAANFEPAGVDVSLTIVPGGPCTAACLRLVGSF